MQLHEFAPNQSESYLRVTNRSSVNGCTDPVSLFYNNIILSSSFNLNLLLFHSLNFHRVSSLLHSLVNLGFYLPSLPFSNGLNQILKLRTHSHLAQFLFTVPEHEWPSSPNPPTDPHSLCSGCNRVWAAQLDIGHTSSRLSLIAREQHTSTDFFVAYFALFWS